MTKLTGIIMSASKLTGSLGVRNEINVDIIGTGVRGKEGKSAYEIWLDLGNEGTEEEYLASLKGMSAYAAAQLGGYSDTEAKFYVDLAAIDGLSDELEALL